MGMKKGERKIILPLPLSTTPPPKAPSAGAGGCSAPLAPLTGHSPPNQDGGREDEQESGGGGEGSISLD